MSDSDAYETQKVHTKDLIEAHVRHDALSDSDTRNMIGLQSIETRVSPMTPGVVVAGEVVRLIHMHFYKSTVVDT